MLRDFLEAFVPLFVAIDALGMIPIFLGVTGHMPPAQRRRVSLVAVAAALAISLAFMLVARELFRFLGIAETDFRIAGGLLLLTFSMIELFSPPRPASEPAPPEDSVSVVPLATPIIVGPATLTTVLVLVANKGYAATSASLLANFAILLLALVSASAIARRLGNAAMRAFSRIVMILLAAIAVNFIRTGILQAAAGH